ncbi:MAG: hypothetical protein F4X56_10520 [Gammaproteobacteria bacterium]|nr:hypothetical protein [Gammaproteobacteria bacterium]
MNNFNRIPRVCGPSAREAFDEMRDQTPFLFPLLFVIVGTLIVLVVIGYPTKFSLFDSLFHGEAHRMNTQRYFTIGGTRIELNNGFWLTPTVVLRLIYGVLQFCLDIGVRLLLIGTYFYAIARWLRMDTRWEHWFGLSCWTNIPMIVVPAVLLIVGTIALTRPVPKAVVFLLWIVFCFTPISWSVYITVQGLLSWTEKDRSFCVKIALIPYGLLLLTYSPAIIASLRIHPYHSLLD